MWFDDEQNTYKIQTTPVKIGSFQRVGRGLTPMDGMTFVHQGQFFAVAPNRETMERYIKYIFEVWPRSHTFLFFCYNKNKKDVVVVQSKTPPSSKDDVNVFRCVVKAQC